MATKNIAVSELKKLNSWFLALGILFVFFGFGIILLPVIGSITVELLFGVVLLFTGISELALAFLARKWTGFLFILISGVLTLLAASLLLFYPITGLVALTLFLGVFLFAQGLVKVAKAFSLKPKHHWEWLLFDGLLSLLLGVLIILQWPSDAVWVIGLLFGIDLAFGGLSFIMLYQATK